MRKPLILLALCLTAFIVSLDVLIVNVALPTLVRRLGTTTTELQWVVNAYALVFAALILAAGSLSDRQGRKGTMLVGFGVLAASSLGGALVDTAGGLIAARAVMGIGAALMFPATLSILVNVFTERAERARAIGLWGAASGFGVATGPIVGGWLLSRYWWGSIFLFTALVVVGVAVLTALVVPTSRNPRTPPIDWRGLCLSSVGIGALVVGVIEAPHWGWTAAPTLSAVALGMTLLLIFVIVELRISNPMLDVAMFANPRFSVASAAIAISFFSLDGFIFVITQYFQFVKSYSALSTGVRLLPMAAAVGLSSVTGAKLAVKIGNKIVVATGLVLFAAGLAWASTNAGATSYGAIASQMLLLGVGFGLTSAPATEAIMGAVSEVKAGVGAAVNDATRLVGGTLGVAVIGSVVVSAYQSRLVLPAGLPEQAVSAANGSLGGAIVVSEILSDMGLDQMAQALSTSATSAFLDSLLGGGLLAAGVALAGAVLAGVFLPARPRETRETTSPSSMTPAPARFARSPAASSIPGTSSAMSSSAEPTPPLEEGPKHD